MNGKKIGIIIGASVLGVLILIAGIVTAVLMLVKKTDV